MKKIIVLYCFLSSFLGVVKSQELDTIINTNINKSILYSNAQMWAIETKPYIDKEMVLSDPNIGRVILKVKHKINKDDIQTLKDISYSIECNLIIDVKDSLYKVSIKAPTILINPDSGRPLNRMSTKQLLSYKDELELINSIVMEDSDLNGLIYWSVDDIKNKGSIMSRELEDLKAQERVSKRKIKNLESKINVISEMISLWDVCRLDIINSITKTMSDDNSF